MTIIRAIALAAAGLAGVAFARPALAQRAAYEAMIEAHAKANNVPVALVHRVVIRESKYNAHLIGRGRTMGLMQIKLATARGVGYTGTAEGLLDPETNITYGVRYLAGAWRVAHGNYDRAVMHYARGYYYDEKRLRLPPIRYASLPMNKPPLTEATDAASAESDAEPTTPAPALAAGPAQPIVEPQPSTPQDMLREAMLRRQQERAAQELAALEAAATPPPAEAAKAIAQIPLPRPRPERAPPRFQATAVAQPDENPVEALWGRFKRSLQQ